MDQIPIHSRDSLRFAELVGSKRAEALSTALVDSASQRLDGRRLVNVNSTGHGGGVAEMLHVLLGYAQGAGLKVSWHVIEADETFFVLTKRIHNRLYGHLGDGGPLGSDEHEIYRTAMEANTADLTEQVQRGDVVILHDPQTAGLAAGLKSIGCHVIWRCHVGVSEQDENSVAGWNFLRPYLEPFVDRYVFTDARFVPKWMPQDRCSVIWPSVDPFSPKNQEFSQSTVEGILSHVGIIAGRVNDTAFQRLDGSTGHVDSYCDIIRTGPAPPPDTPLVVQVSRWDSMKDMPGVMAAFAKYVAPRSDAQLVLAGPASAAVADDPEGDQVLQDCWQKWRLLPDAIRHRIQLVCVPMHDPDENAAIVNALQRQAVVVSQKSIAEGFGLTVTEAMLKGTPVVASAVGGIIHQMVDGETGRLVADPMDLRSYGDAVSGLLDDGELALHLGEGAKRRALEKHLGDTHLKQWLKVLEQILPGSG